MPACHRIGWGAALTMLAVLGALGGPSVAAAAPGVGGGWSSAPRWRLPARRCVPRCRNAKTNRAPHPAPPVEAAVSAPASKPAHAPRSSPPPNRPPPAPPSADPRAGRRPAPSATTGVPPAPDATAVMDLGPTACRQTLRKARISFEPARGPDTAGVAQPVRLTGPIRGVVFAIPWSKDPSHDPHGIWDCRLVAAMIPLADWLADQGIREVHYFSVLRAPSNPRKKRRSQHNSGLAIDILGFVPRSTARARSAREVALARWDVEVHYPKGQVRSCPARTFRDHPADVFAQFVCFATQRGLIHTLLTPDFDHAHRNHLHLDLKEGQTRPADPFVSLSE